MDGRAARTGADGPLSLGAGGAADAGTGVSTMVSEMLSERATAGAGVDRLAGNDSAPLEPGTGGGVAGSGITSRSRGRRICGRGS
jgi:hypothetical protein